MFIWSVTTLIDANVGILTTCEGIVVRSWNQEWFIFNSWPGGFRKITKIVAETW